MRYIQVVKKTIKENIRDWKILSLTVSFAPFFVIVMYYYLSNAVTEYRISIINHDKGTQLQERNGHINNGEELITEIVDYFSLEKSARLQLIKEETLSVGLEKVKKQSIDLLIEIPDNFSQTLHEYKNGTGTAPVTVKSYVNPANEKNIMTVALCDYVTRYYADAVTGTINPLIMLPVSVSNEKTKSDFQLYVPILLALSLMMLMFTASSSIIREKDAKTIIRLRMSSLTTFEWLSAISLSQIIIGLCTVGLTYLTAMALGFRSSASLPSFLVISILSILSIVGISIWVASFLRNSFDLWTIGCFPFFILMFFSGGMMPLPPVHLFSLGKFSISINDFLPTTHTVTALRRIFNNNAGITELGFEIGAITVLTIFLYATGLIIFSRRQMKPQKSASL